MDQMHLFPPPAEPLAWARARISAARDRDLEAQGRPRPRPSRPVSQGERTIEAMPRGGVIRDLAPHGTRARYNSRQPCRCPACCKANTRYMRTYRTTRAERLAVHGRPVVDTPPLERYGEP